MMPLVSRRLVKTHTARSPTGATFLLDWTGYVADKTKRQTTNRRQKYLGRKAASTSLKGDPLDFFPHHES